jgi:phenylpropionate dioxygenase-like ring-hydroxylating dioxygenase large terminal subunit
VTPIARELLTPSLDTFGHSSTLPAEAYTAGSVFRWEQEHFFDRGWVCAGRAGGLEVAGNRRVVEWQGWLFANASGDAPAFEEHVGNLEELVRNHGCEELVVASGHDYQIAANWKILVENYHECYHCSSIPSSARSARRQAAATTWSLRGPGSGAPWISTRVWRPCR